MGEAESLGDDLEGRTEEVVRGDSEADKEDEEPDKVEEDGQGERGGGEGTVQDLHVVDEPVHVLAVVVVLDKEASAKTG